MSDDKKPHNVISLHKDTIMSCNECDNAAWYLSDHGTLICTHCDNEPEGLIWAYMMSGHYDS